MHILRHIRRALMVRRRRHLIHPPIVIRRVEDMDMDMDMVRTRPTAAMGKTAERSRKPDRHKPGRSHRRSRCSIRGNSRRRPGNSAVSRSCSENRPAAR
jgi:hypothetical protein